MLIENMKMAFSAIRANKMRSALTMLESSSVLVLLYPLVSSAIP